MSRLRRLLGAADAVTQVEGGYRLDVTDDAVDALRFERLAADGRDRLRAGDAGSAAALLETVKGALMRSTHAYDRQWDYLSGFRIGVEDLLRQRPAASYDEAMRAGRQGGHDALLAAIRAGSIYTNMPDHSSVTYSDFYGRQWDRDHPPRQ